MTLDRPRVLLVWPGGLFSAEGNFGVPQLLSIAAALEQAQDAIVDIIDLDHERARGGPDWAEIARTEYDLVGLSCYSSYDLLKVMALARALRRRMKRAWFVVGGYHASARPGDFTRSDSPFDFVVQGDGERPLANLLTARVRGRRPLNPILPSLATSDPSELLPYRWELLERYRPTARRIAGQAEIYLSRGCPFDCSFCMERAKREVSWRPLDADQAVEELHRLDAFLDLRGLTVFIADALFGMKPSWRKRFLEGLARRPTRATRVWALIRLDLVDREDLELMARANMSPGFGLESGDPDQLRRIRKTGKLDGWIDKMFEVTEWARELDVPFGANIIVGHPGETEASLRRTAGEMRRLFNGPRGTHGFLSVDAFRLYPGSPIDDARAAWEADTGMRVHRYPWWEDGDQEFLAEWVDPSDSLTFRDCHRLRHEQFGPIVTEIERAFAYQGPAREYFMRAAREQTALFAPERQLHTLGLWHLWGSLTESTPRGPVIPGVLATDPEAGALARRAREPVVATLGGGPALQRALARVPREQFVFDPTLLSATQRDEALPLGEGATISAFHAYVASFGALGLTAGDHLVDLGGGTGYGAALASEIVGPGGSVLSIELRPELAEHAGRALSAHANVTLVEASAHDTRHWAGASKVVCGFAVADLPESWTAALADGGTLVVPVGRGDVQRLTRFTKRGDTVEREDLGPVCYVRDASEGPLAARIERSVDEHSNVP